MVKSFLPDSLLPDKGIHCNCRKTSKIAHGNWQSVPLNRALLGHLRVYFYSFSIAKSEKLSLVNPSTPPKTSLRLGLSIHPCLDGYEVQGRVEEGCRWLASRVSLGLEMTPHLVVPFDVLGKNQNSM